MAEAMLSLSNLDIKNYHTRSQQCGCQCSSFSYQPHKLVIARDSPDTANAKLQQFISKGPKYQEANKINCRKSEIKIFECINNYTLQPSKREHTYPSYTLVCNVNKRQDGN